MSDQQKLERLIETVREFGYEVHVERDADGLPTRVRVPNGGRDPAVLLAFAAIGPMSVEQQ